MLICAVVVFHTDVDIQEHKVNNFVMLIKLSEYCSQESCPLYSVNNCSLALLYQQGIAVHDASKIVIVSARAYLSSSMYQNKFCQHTFHLSLTNKCKNHTTLNQ